jgi:hypothetical protein
MKKKDKKWQTTRTIRNSNKRISCDTYASNLGDKFVSGYRNPKDSRGGPKRLLSDNNHTKNNTISVVCHPDKVHFVGNTGIVTELIRTYSFFESVEITKACISRQGGASYLKHSRKLPPQIQKTIQHEYHIP